MSGTGYVPLPTPVTANPQFWNQGLEGLNALRDYQAKQATAQIYQQSIDPSTGQIDQGKFNALLAANPRAAWNAGAAMQQQGQAQGAQANAGTAQVAQASAVYNMAGTAAASIGLDPSDANIANVRAGLVAAKAPQGVLDELDRIGAMRQPDGTPDLAQRKLVAYQHTLGMMDAQHRMAVQGFPSYTPQNVGNQIVPIGSVPGSPGHPGGVVQGQGSVATGLSPQDVSQIVTITMDDGKTTQQMPLGDALQLIGKNPAIRMLGQPAAGGGGGVGPGGLDAQGNSATRKANEGGPPAAGTPAAAVAQRTHDFWISQGYNEAQVAGILAGGPGSESDFSPTAVGDKGTSYGLYQHHADRLVAMQKYFGLPAGQMPTEAQQNQYAAWEISPQGPLAAVGAQLRQAQTPAQAAMVWTGGFGVPADKGEILRRANGAQRFVGLYGGQPGQPQGPPGSVQPPAPAPVASNAPTPPAPATAPLPVPPAPVPPPRGSGFGATAFSQPSTALPAPPSTATAPNTTAVVPAVPTPQMTAATAVARKTGRPAPIAGTDGLFANPDGSVGSGPRAGGLGRRADINPLIAGVQTAQTTMPAANALVAGPGAPTATLPAATAPTVPPANAFGGGAFGGSAAAPAPAATPASAPAPPAQSTAPPGRSTIETVAKAKGNIDADIAARNQASAGAADQRRTLQAGESALEALRLAKGYTGPGTDFTSRASAFLQAQAPDLFVPQGGMTDTAWRQVLAKNLLRFAQNSGIRGNTDLGLSEQLKGSANVDAMLPAANEHVLIQDIGLARQRMAQTMLMPPPSTEADVVNHMKSYTGNTDYRGFSWDLMSQAARDAIEAEAKKSGPAAVARLTKAIHDGIALGITKPPPAPAASQSGQ